MIRISSAAKTLGACAGALFPLVAAAQPDVPAPTRGAFSILDDNDFFGGWSDKYYTNHTRLALTLGADAAADKFRGSWFFSLGQEMYTPREREAEIPDPRDHPYAGYLYASGGKALFSDDLAIAAEIQLGLTGDGSLAEEAQKEYHRILDEIRPQGWDTQIDGRLVGQALGEIRRRFVLDGACGNGAWGTDLIARGFGGFGNLRGQLSAGAQLRAGWNLPKDFGAASMRQSTSVVFDPQVDRSLYGFFDVQADAVFWDETLTGNNGDGADIYAYPLVAQFTIGVCAVYDRFMLSVFQAFRSKDFSSQDKDFFAYGGFKFSVFF